MANYRIAWNVQLYTLYLSMTFKAMASLSWLHRCPLCYPGLTYVHAVMVFVQTCKLHSLHIFMWCLLLFNPGVVSFYLWVAGVHTSVVSFYYLGLFGFYQVVVSFHPGVVGFHTEVVTLLPGGCHVFTKWW